MLLEVDHEYFSPTVLPAFIITRMYHSTYVSGTASLEIAKMKQRHVYYVDECYLLGCDVSVFFLLVAWLKTNLRP
jgi:hypothetical protein